MDYYWVYGLLGQALAGFISAVGVVVGLRLALPSFARALRAELQREDGRTGDEGAARPADLVVETTAQPVHGRRDYLSGG